MASTNQRDKHTNALNPPVRISQVITPLSRFILCFGASLFSSVFFQKCFRLRKPATLERRVRGRRQRLVSACVRAPPLTANQKNVGVFSIECSNLWASTIFTQCNAVIIIIIQLLIMLLFLFLLFFFFSFLFVFVQNKCVKISEEDVNFLIL